MRAPRIGSFVLALYATVAVASAAPSTRPTGAPAAFDARADVDLGVALLKEQDYASAQGAFEAALKVDPNDARAVHGVALCLLGRSRPDKAVIFLERAIRLSPGDRAIANNLASVRLQAGDAPRAAKVLAEHLATLKGAALDEPLVDALGAALAAFDERQRKGRPYLAGVAARDAAIERLEKARPGERKFGTRWVSTTSLKEIEEGNATTRDQIANADLAIDACERRLAALHGQRDELLRKVPTGFAQPWELEQNEAQIVDQEQKLAAERVLREDVEKRLIRPEWPSSIELVSIDAVAPAGLIVPRDEPTPVRDPGEPSPVPARPPATAPQGPGLSPPRSGATRPVAPADSPRLVTRFAAGFAVAPDKVVTSALTVRGASAIRITLSDGTSGTAEVVRVDASSGLALLKVPGANLVALDVADRTGDGPAEVVSFPALNLFAPVAQRLAGTVETVDGETSIRLPKSPGLAGGPLMMGNRVAGVVMTDRLDADPPVRLVTATELRQFLGEDVAPPGRGAVLPVTSVLLVTAERADKGEGPP